MILINNPSPIDQFYQKIINKDKTSIYDAETALRLSSLLHAKGTDIRFYLVPVTKFDRDLMVQFGLYD